MVFSRYSFSYKQLLEKATTLLERAGIAIKAEGGMLSYHWLRDFLKRHPELRVRRGQVLSQRRARALDADKIKEYFAFLKNLVKTRKYKSIWSVDESGFSTKELEKLGTGKAVGSEDGNVTIPSWQVHTHNLLAKP